MNFGSNWAEISASSTTPLGNSSGWSTSPCSNVTKTPVAGKPSTTPLPVPMPGEESKLASTPGDCISAGYDLVCNGSEIAGGSVRIHDQAIQAKVFELLGLDGDTAKRSLASFWTPCSMAPRPTAVLPSDWTDWSCFWLAPTTSAT